MLPGLAISVKLSFAKRPSILISSRSALVAENLFLRKQLALLKERKDYVIPVNENHLKRILGEFIIHYNEARPHSALGPGIPEPPPEQIPKATIGIDCLPALASGLSQFWVGSTMNTRWRKRLPEWRTDFLRSTGVYAYRISRTITVNGAKSSIRSLE